jgi:hypothetical protein
MVVILVNEVARAGDLVVLGAVGIHPVGLLLRLHHAEAFEQVERVDRRTLLVADDAAGAVGAFHVHDLVDDVGEVGLHAEVEIAPAVVVADGNLPAVVGDDAGVLVRRSESDGGGDVELHQDAVGLLVVVVGGDRKAVPQRSVETDVGHVGSLPGDVLVGERILGHDGVDLVGGGDGTDR